MCIPKAPKEDPAAKASREQQLAMENERVAEQKRRMLEERKRGFTGNGLRSLISGGKGAVDNTMGPRGYDV